MMRTIFLSSILLVSLGTPPSVAQGFLERVDMTAPCYVRTTRPLTLRTGQPVPIGVDIGITADAGSAWLTTDERSLPLVSKPDAGRPDCIDFRPAIEGRVSRSSAVYQRMPVLGDAPSMRLATKIQPGREGYVVPAGEPLHISRREGAYYVVDTSAQRRILLPVDAVEAAPELLRTGRPVSLPPRSTAEASPAPTNGSSPASTAVAEPLNGPLYGRLRIPLTLGRRVLEAGNYVQIGYDAGDQWVIGTSMPQEAPLVSKAAVELIERTVFPEPLLGRARRSTPTFDSTPNLERDPTRLLQSGPGGFLTPRLAAGQEVNIRAREGDVVEIVPIVVGQRSRVVRVPASEIEIVHGDPNSGRPVRVPPLQAR